MAQRTIYVGLVDEGVDVWRPVQSEERPDGAFQLPDHAPDGETWAFPPGSSVRCEWQDLADGPALVAAALAD